MAMVWLVERQIEQVEGFSQVVLFNKAGKRLPRFLWGVPAYPFKTPEAGDSTVQEWQQSRFKLFYPDMQVSIFVPDYHRRMHKALNTMKLDFIRQRVRLGSENK